MKYYPLTSICKDDLTERFTAEQIDKLTDEDMKRIASKMSDAYLDQSYWIDLEIITKDILDTKENA